MIKRFLISFAALSALGFVHGQNSGQQANTSNFAGHLANTPFRNPTLPIEERVKDLVSRMTLEEKVSQMSQNAAAIPRLGIPQYAWSSEGLHGVGRGGYATVFPQAIGLAATFDPDLLRKEADVIATEFRAKYADMVRKSGYSDLFHGLTVWSPNINIVRDPRWGRAQETFGEDPFLTAQMGVAYVTGLQGDDPKYLKALATPKHFAVHSGPESTRHTADVKVSAHDLEDTYLPAFRATVAAGAGSVMCAYNSVDGNPACAQPMLLQEHLRGAWNFQGYVVSDCGAVTDIQQGHHYAATPEQATAAAVKSGMDLDCEFPFDKVTERDAILKAVQEGLISEQEIDRAVRRLFTARIKLGMFDPPEIVPYSRISIADNDTEPHRQLALKAARESLVLLKNSGDLLPLNKRYKTVAVIGPNADNVDPLLGDYNGVPSRPVTILAGIRKRFSDSTVLYAPGSSLTGLPLEPIPPKFLRDNSGKPGLTAEYFKGTELQGVPVVTRSEPGINFNWQNNDITSEIGERVSVRWTGTLVAPATGEYEVGFTATSAFHIWFDDQLIGESDFNDTSNTLHKAFHLEAGHAYSVKIECSQEGYSWTAKLVWHRPGNEDALSKIVSRADLIVAVMGLAGDLEGEEMSLEIEGFHGGDRTTLDLPRAQEQLLESLVATGKPVILVLMNGSALAITWAHEHVGAILEAWYPGEEGGTAVAEALAGDFSPAGKLPVTFYKSVDQLPPLDDYQMTGRTYRYSVSEPLYPFGYGLSYTRFEYSNLKFEKKTLAADDDLIASVNVKNIGKMTGDEVVELYLTHSGVEGAPIRALAGFRRVHLTSGETQRVRITVSNRNLSIVDAGGVRRVVRGKLHVWVGGGQPLSREGLAKAGVLGTVSIAGEKDLAK